MPEWSFPGYICSIIFCGNDVSEKFVLDRFSRGLLEGLMRDARQTVQQLGDAVGLSASPSWKRIKDLEAAGVIRGYTAVVDAEKVGLGLRVIVEANLAQHSEDRVRAFEGAVAAVPQIVACHSTTGDADYLMTVLVADIKAYEQFQHDTLFRLPGITRVRSRIVLRELKSDVRLPLPDAATPAAAPARRRPAVVAASRAGRR